MAWTATLVELQKSEYVLTYSREGWKPYSIRYQATIVTDDVIKQSARSEIAKQESAEAATGKVTLEVGKPLDLSLPSPTAAEIESAEWNTKRMELRGLVDAARDGLIDANDKRITDLQLLLRGAL